MAYPVLLAAGMALSAAGAGASIAGAKKSERAMEKSVQAEIKRQRGYRDEAMQAYQQSLEQSGADVAQQQTEQGEAARAAAYKRLESIPLAAPSNTQAPVESTTAGRVAGAQERNLAGAQANYMGLSEWQLQQLIKNMRARQRLGLIGTVSADSAGVNPYEIQNASHAGDTLGGIGTALGAAGSLLGSYGALSAPATAATRVPIRGPIF